MPGIINPSDLTFNGKEVQALSEAIMTEAFESPSLNEFHTIVTGIEAKQQIAILGLFGLVGKTSTGCAPDENPGQITNSQKFWNPAYIEDRFAQCWKDLKATFFIWGLKHGVKKADLTSTDFANFLEDRLKIALKESVFRIAWFSDTAIANYNDSPAGVLKNGISEAYFNAIEGLWKQIFAIMTAAPKQYVAISKNTGANYAAQEFDDTDTTNQVVTKMFRKMLTKADTRLSEQSNPVFVVTKSVADQYQSERLQATGIEPAYTRVEDGWDVLKVGGKTIHAFSFWDRMIQSYFDSGTKYHLPHRAILTTVENIQIGTEEESNLAELNPFYDETLKKYYVDFGYNIDSKIIEDYKLMAAY